MTCILCTYVLMYVNDFSYVNSYVFILLLKLFIPEHGICENPPCSCILQFHINDCRMLIVLPLYSQLLYTKLWLDHLVSNV